MTASPPVPTRTFMLVLAMAAAASTRAQTSRPESAPAAADPAVVAEVRELYGAATAAVAEGDFESFAETAAEADALRAERARAPSLAIAQALDGLGNALVRAGRASEALPRLQAALAERETLLPDDHPQIGASANNVAVCLSEVGRQGDALPVFERALTIRRKFAPGDDREVALLNFNLAAGLQGLGRMAEALPRFEEAAAMSARLFAGDHPDVAAGLNGVAVCLHEMGRSAEALTSFDAALAMLRRLGAGDRPDAALALHNSGVCLTRLGRPAEALPRLEAATAMCRRLFAGGHPLLAACLGSVAGALLELGRPAEALPHLEEALALQARLYGKEDGNAAQTLVNLGACLMGLGRPADARGPLERAVVYTREQWGERHAAVAGCLNNLAVCLSDLGAEEEALSTFRAALDVTRHVYPPEHPFVASAWNNVGTILSETERSAEALPYYEAALDIWRRREPGDHPDKALALNNTASCLVALGRPAEAIPRLDEAVTMARRGSYPLLPSVLRNRAHAAHATGDARRAAEDLDEAAEAVEGRRHDVVRLPEHERRAYERTLLGPVVYEELCVARLRLGESGAAFEALERGRGRATLDLLARARLDPLAEARRRAAGTDDAKLIARIDAAASAITAAEAALAGETAAEAALLTSTGLDAEARAVALERVAAAAATARGALYAAHSDRARLVSDVVPLGTPATLAKTRTLLAGRERLLAYMVGVSGSRMFLVRPAGGEVVARELLWPDGAAVTAASLTTAVDAYLAASAVEGRASVARGVDAPEGPSTRAYASRDAARRLFAALIPNDVWPEVRDAGRLEVLPDGALHRLPFEALVVPLDDVATPGPAVAPRYWLDVGPQVVYASSAAARLEARRLRDARRTAAPEFAVLAVGDPTAAAGAGFAPLPDARREIAAVEAVVAGLHDPLRGALNVRALVGPEATESAVFADAPRARILHFATHYLVEDSADGGFSALVLAPTSAPGNTDDGFLRVRDVVERWRDRLPATELVVLGACDSKGGRRVQEDSLVALPAAFHYAGVPAVVAALWRVEDRATADLMADFYRRVFDPAENAAAAPATLLERFTRARRALRARRPDPYHWAPFVWIGDPR